MSSMLTFRMNSCVATLLSHCSFITGNTTAHTIWGQGQNLRLHRLHTCVIIFERLWYSLNTWFVITWSINKRQIAIQMPPCLSHLICRQLRKNFKGMIWIPRPTFWQPSIRVRSMWPGSEIKARQHNRGDRKPKRFCSSSDAGWLSLQGHDKLMSMWHHSWKSLEPALAIAEPAFCILKGCGLCTDKAQRKRNACAQLKSKRNVLVLRRNVTARAHLVKCWLHVGVKIFTVT